MVVSHGDAWSCKRAHNFLLTSESPTIHTCWQGLLAVVDSSGDLDPTLHLPRCRPHKRTLGGPRVRSLRGSADVKKKQANWHHCRAASSGLRLVVAARRDSPCTTGQRATQLQSEKQEKKAKEGRQDKKPGGEAEERQRAVGTQPHSPSFYPP